MNPLQHIGGKIAHWLFALLAVTLGATLSGCNPQDQTSSDNGEVVIGLTDAEGDFATYTVDVLSLQLTKANGAVVDALPLSTRVDFAQYTDMTEFLTAATIPSGTYVKASMVLDYSNADIQVEDADGNAVPVTTIVDGDGNAVSQLTVAVQLEGRNALTIVRGVPAHLTLDFDLSASNSWAADTQTLTVEPFLLADLDVQKFKTHRLRGPLASVDVNAGTFDVIIRPFVYALGGNHRDFGDMTVTTTNDTIFDIDNESYQGNAGLVALAAKDALTAVVVMGEVKRKGLSFEATEVHAGASVPGGSQDAVTGNVIARSGNTLTVKGATLIRAGGSAVFNDQVTVELGDATSVKRQLSLGNSYTIDDISVGQRVAIFGTLTNSTATQLQMDAGASVPGYVQMRFTTLRGTVVANSGGDFALKLQAIDGRHVALFDFAGTGSDATNDADPSQYEIDTGSLDVSGLALGAPVKVRGFVRPFAQAPKDFTAHTVVDVTAVTGVLAVNWNPPSATALTDISASGLTLDLTGVGIFHHIARGWVSVDLTQQSVPTQIQPANGGNGLYWINQGGTHQLYLSFANFADGLTSRLTAGAAVKGIVATGTFDDDSGVLASNLISVEVQ
jgi:hypothetical protein